jgi:hypothetical protein
MTETDSVSETTHFIVFRIKDDGQSQKPRNSEKELRYVIFLILLLVYLSVLQVFFSAL